MTFRLIFGVDPGQTGAIAMLADGVPAGFLDMPTRARKAGGEMVDAVRLATLVRDALLQHPGAYPYAVIEQVSAGPGQGVSAMFRFGQSDGIARGVLGALGLPVIEVHPSVWKKFLQLTGLEKDAARQLAIARFPAIEPLLRRKKDGGRADALLVALWAHLTEQIARAA